MSTELVQLRSFYAEPGFALLALTDAAAPAGCVALRDLGGGTGELRRLFVAPTERTGGIGRALTRAALHEATLRGFDRMVLNTLPTMTHALGLYEQLRFVRIDPYVSDPTSGVIYLERSLAAAPGTL